MECQASASTIKQGTEFIPIQVIDNILLYSFNLIF